MMEPTLSLELANAASDLQAEPDVEHTVQSVLQHAQSLTGGEGAGVMVRHRHQMDSVAASTPEAGKADQFQVEQGDGPSVAAMSFGDAVVMDELSRDARWPHWTLPAADLGFRSAISMPLGVGKTPFGALNLYSTRPGAFADCSTAAQIYARHVSVAMATARYQSGLRQAINARHVIGQAQGMLMERYGLDADKALALLRRGARDRNVKLSERAAQVISTRRVDGG